MVQLEFPDPKMHKVVNVSHATPFYEQPRDISNVIANKTDPVFTREGNEKWSLTLYKGIENELMVWSLLCTSAYFTTS